MPLPRWLVAPVVALALAVTGPAFAAVPAHPRTVTVALALRPASPAALDRLADAHGLAPATRARLAAALVPGAARHHAVGAAAARLGLSVTDRAGWTMLVHAPAARATALFGTAGRTPGGLTHAYPRVPAALSPYVVAAFPATGPVARPLAITTGYQGSDFRTAYSAPDGRPMAGGQPLTVATVQLSGWHASDLSTYASAAGLPLASGQYVAVSVDKANPGQPDDSNGDTEVALDQESLLSSAPSANQRAYFAPNAGTGYFDAINRVAADAASQRIAALSLSWGGCEFVDPTNPDPDLRFYAAMDQALKYAVAAGITVFAATGDNGSLDCYGQVTGPAQYQPAVDYPASSPWVVGVGGTTLPDPSNPAGASAWLYSGGGESTVEELPAFQWSVRARSVYGGRLVPDIASFADFKQPSTGFDFYDSLNTAHSNGGWALAGGTSLAAPTQTGLFADVLMAGGYQAGIGDIHDAIYDAHADAFTDITTGNNGGYSARSGYDEVTGRGTPVWSTLVSSLADFRLTAPTATRSTSVALHVTLPTGLGYRGWAAPSVDTLPGCDPTSTTPPTSATLPAVDGWHTVYVAGRDRSIADGGAGTCHIVGTRVLLDRTRPSVHVRVTITRVNRAWASWWSSDPAPSSGLLHYVVRIRDARGVVWSATTGKTGHAFPTTGGRAFSVSVTAVDRAGNRTTRAARLYDDTAAALHDTSRWQAWHPAGDFHGTLHVSGRSGQRITFSVTARAYTLYVSTCPRCGEIAVRDGAGHLIRRIDTYSARVRHRVRVLLFRASTTHRRTFVLRVVHRHDRRSRGYRVGIDGLSTATA